MHRIKCYKSTPLGYALTLETADKNIAKSWLQRQTEGFIQFPTKSTKTI